MLCDLHKILSTSKYEEEIEENKDEKEDMIKRMTFRPGARTSDNSVKPSNLIWEKDEISAGFALQKLSEVRFTLIVSCSPSPNQNSSVFQSKDLDLG